MVHELSLRVFLPPLNIERVEAGEVTRESAIPDVAPVNTAESPCLTFTPFLNILVSKCIDVKFQLKEWR
jgi:hypothetical protein